LAKREYEIYKFDITFSGLKKKASLDLLILDWDIKLNPNNNNNN